MARKTIRMHYENRKIYWRAYQKCRYAKLKRNEILKLEDEYEKLLAASQEERAKQEKTEQECHREALVLFKQECAEWIRQNDNTDPPSFLQIINQLQINKTLNELKDAREKWIKTLLSKVAASSKYRGLSFNLIQEDIMLPEKCPVLGTPLCRFVATEPEDISLYRFVPTLDRIDNSKGYEPDNIEVMSWRANKLKNDATLEELVQLGEWAKKKLELLANIN